MGISEELFVRAQKRIPGGVNSPVRAYGSVGLVPRFIARADRQHIYDVDGKEYVDYVGSWGPMILGHNHPVVTEAVERAIKNGLSFGAASQPEVEMAELICELAPSVEMVRMVNSGTEAVMSAIRVARGYTGRDQVIKFAGCYHGHSDSMLVKAGSGVMTAGIPDSAGVPAACAQDTLTANYNDLESVEQLFLEHPDSVAAVIVEPLAANMGVVPPKKGFLAGLRKLCDEYGAVLIFDEVITGFRLALGGAQERYGVLADLTTFGKIVGAGMPVGAYGGKKALMELVSPVGPVYQAGTLSGNPVAMAAGLAQLRWLKSHPETYHKLEQLGCRLREGLRRALPDCTITGDGSLGCVFFSDGPVANYADAKRSDTVRFSRYFKFMLEQGIYLAPSQFEALFLSDAHTQADIDNMVRLATLWEAMEENGASNR